VWPNDLRDSAGTQWVSIITRGGLGQWPVEGTEAAGENPMR
jgi:hypothetical protein